MAIASRLDALENRFGRVVAWAVALVLVAVGLPPLLLWQVLRQGWRKTVTSRRPSEPEPHARLAGRLALERIRRRPAVAGLAGRRTLARPPGVHKT
jgi:hypothetical protein